MNKENLFKMLIGEVIKISEGEGDLTNKLYAVCKLLKDNLPDYDWVGFYLVDRDNDRELVLGPYLGDPTNHIRIPFGEGICGQAAETEKTFIVDDVTAQNNYLSCSINVKSEIVVPIFKDDRIIGELDIDSHRRSAFSEQDEQFLVEIARITANLF